MKLSVPFKGATPKDVTQGWRTTIHPAFDMVKDTKTLGYGTPLTAPEDCYVIRLKGDNYTPNDNSGLKGGYGIWLKGKETGQVHLYWHTLPIFPVRVLDDVKRGQIVAYMGNAGMVFAGGKYVPVEERLLNKKGTHLHWEVYDSTYKLGGKKPFVDFTNQIDWDSQPTYTIADQISATAVVVAKISKLLKK